MEVLEYLTYLCKNTMSFLKNGSMTLCLKFIMVKILLTLWTRTFGKNYRNYSSKSFRSLLWKD